MQVAALGADTMGRGIAQVSAMAGHEVQLRDIDIVGTSVAGLTRPERTAGEGVGR